MAATSSPCRPTPPPPSTPPDLADCVRVDPPRQRRRLRLARSRSSLGAATAARQVHLGPLPLTRAAEAVTRFDDLAPSGLGAEFGSAGAQERARGPHRPAS